MTSSSLSATIGNVTVRDKWVEVTLPGYVVTIHGTDHFKEVRDMIRTAVVGQQMALSRELLGDLPTVNVLANAFIADSVVDINDFTINRGVIKHITGATASMSNNIGLFYTSDGRGVTISGTDVCDKAIMFLSNIMTVLPVNYVRDHDCAN